MKGILLIRFFTVREEKLLRILTQEGTLRLRALAAAGKSRKFGLSLEPPLLMDFERAGGRLIDYTVAESFDGIKSSSFLYFLFWSQAALASVLFPEGIEYAPLEEFLNFLFFLERLSGNELRYRNVGKFRETALAGTFEFMFFLLRESGWLSREHSGRYAVGVPKKEINAKIFLKTLKKVLIGLGLNYPVQKIDELWETFSRWE